MFLSTPNFLLEIKSVPDVPREILHPPSPTVAVPTAAAALSPAPAITFTSSDTPSSAAISAFKVPTTSQLSYSFGSCASVIPQISSILQTSTYAPHPKAAFRKHLNTLCKKNLTDGMQGNPLEA